MPDLSPSPSVPVRSLARSLASLGRARGLLPGAGEVLEAGDLEGAGERAWADAAAAASLLEPRGKGAWVRGKALVRGEAKGAVPSGLERGLEEVPPGPVPGERTRRVGPHPVAGVPATALPGGPGPGSVLVLPARRGRLAREIAAGDVGRVVAHEPDRELREALSARSPGLEVRAAPATEFDHVRSFDRAVADRPLQDTRSLVGLLGRLHHALREGGVLALHDVLLDEARDRRTRGNRLARALRVHLRARGRDLVSRQDLWRLLVETGFQEVRFQAARPGRYVVRARR